MLDEADRLLEMGFEQRQVVHYIRTECLPYVVLKMLLNLSSLLMGVASTLC